MAGLPGHEIDPVTERLICEHGLGGLIFFGRNIESPIQLAKLCMDLQDLAMKSQGTLHSLSGQHSYRYRP